VLIFADDLTGACDAAVPFATTMDVHAATNPERIPRAEVISVDLETRKAASTVVRTAIETASHIFRAKKPRLLIKKIDSVFRGNTFEEIAICLELLPNEIAIVAPAFPALGRTVRGGHLLVEDLSGAATVDIAAGLQRYGVECRLLDISTHTTAGSLRRCIVAQKKAGTKLLLCDASTQADLNLLAQTNFGPDILWIGSGGLAHALAKACRTQDDDDSRVQPHVAGPVIFCIGSDHPVTRRQLQYLRKMSEVVELRPGVNPRAMTCAFRSDISFVLAADRNRNIAADWLQTIVKRAGTLVLSGGDTATMVCQLLKVESIELCSELLPGIPCGWIRGGPTDGVVVVTKSGGFGSEPDLLHIAQQFQLEARAD
jgi:uncharacterized protein YgbK (DUF1537 family)